MMKNEIKWWGWGFKEIRFDVAQKPRMLSYLGKKVGLRLLKPTQQFDIRDVAVPESAMPQSMIDEFRGILGEQGCRTTKDERVLHAAGKSYRDLLMMRSLRVEHAPDVVLYPTKEDDIVQILRICSKHGIALIPFGGGTSVVGGVEANRGDFRYLATLDMKRMNRVLSIDAQSMTATIEAGILGPDLEKNLSGQGYTLGHFPQSFEFSTLGGWIAARSSGQNSILYGRINEMLVNLRIITPSGTIETLSAPAHACGPDINELLVGTEGVIGIIVSATVKIRKAPQVKDYHMYFFKDFREAAKACREVVQSGLSPALIRISDESETEALLAMSGEHGGGFQSWVSRLSKSYLSVRGFSVSAPLSAVLIGVEGTQDEARLVKNRIKSAFSRFDALYVGTRPGKRWLKDRFFLPYLRDDLMDQGLFIETLETSASWSNFLPLYHGVKDAIQSVCNRDDVPATILTHISHLYPDGASLYFTILAGGRRDAPLQQWVDIKNAANEAIFKQHAPISHHHGIGMDHRAHLHWSALERDLVKGMKRTLDQNGILNPGKLL